MSVKTDQSAGERAEPWKRKNNDLQRNDLRGSLNTQSRPNNFDEDDDMVGHSMTHKDASASGYFILSFKFSLIYCDGMFFRIEPQSQHKCFVFKNALSIFKSIGKLRR